MAIVVHCPSCNIRLTLGDDRAGGELPCGRCGEPIAVPAAPKPEAPPARARAAPVSEPDADDEPGPVWWADKRALVGAVAGCCVLVAAGVLVAVLALRKPVEVAQPGAAPAAPTTPPSAGTVPVIPSPPPPQNVQPKAVTPPPKAELVEVALAQGKPRALKLGVNGKGADDFGSILESLGKGYSFTTLTPADMESENRLNQYNVVFQNCLGAIGDPERTSTAIRQFVANGGVLYTSCTQYGLVSKAFADAAPERKSIAGPGIYTVEVLDEGLREYLGPEADLDLGPFVLHAAFTGPDAVIVLRSADKGGRLKSERKRPYSLSPEVRKRSAGVPLDAGIPLLVKFSHGNGQVIYTSFHNSDIAGDTANKLLRYLAFSAVVAEPENRVRRVFLRDGFAVKTADVLTATGDGWAVVKTYTAPAGGTFRVGVGFNNEGADVRLVLEGPGGLTFTRTGSDAFLAEVRHAPAGEWKLTLTATRTPYPNFPLTLFTTAAKTP